MSSSLKTMPIPGRMKSDTDREHNDRHGAVSPREADSDHTYITNLIYRGVDPKTVQYLTGQCAHKIVKADLVLLSVKMEYPEE